MPVKILVADDDRAMLNLYAKIFSQTDYAVTPAETFAQASALLREGEFDLLITDFMFPDGVGTELIRLFNEAKAGAKSLLVTGTPCAREHADCEGVNCYLEKPFKVEQLIQAVSKVLA
ncbi:MAG: response regulator [Elusimicrobiales bacterium]|nr:response regulator [Elusimicrobiales bacterium]